MYQIKNNTDYTTENKTHTETKLHTRDTHSNRRERKNTRKEHGEWCTCAANESLPETRSFPHFGVSLMDFVFAYIIKCGS